MKIGYNMIIGCNSEQQGTINLDLSKANSYVITSLDYLLDNTDELLIAADNHRKKRDEEEC